MGKLLTTSTHHLTYAVNKKSTFHIQTDLLNTENFQSNFPHGEFRQKTGSHLLNVTERPELGKKHGHVCHKREALFSQLLHTSITACD